MSRPAFALLVAALLSACEQRVTSSNPTPAEVPSPVVETIPPGAEKMRVHWGLKLPPAAGVRGEYVFRDRASFAGFLEARGGESSVARYEKWNGIDFGRQVAVVAIDERTSGGYDLRILGIWTCATEIIVELLEVYPDPGSAGTAAITYPTVSAVVNRSDLPVRFLRRGARWNEVDPSAR